MHEERQADDIAWRDEVGLVVDVDGDVVSFLGFEEREELADVFRYWRGL